MIYFNITLPSTLRSSTWSPFLKFSHQNPVHNSPLRHTCQCPAHLILPYLITQEVFGVEHRSFSFSLRDILHSTVTLSLLGPNILLSITFSDTLSLYSSLNVTDPRFTTIQNKRQYNSHVYLNLSIFGYQTGKQKNYCLSLGCGTAILKSKNHCDP